ncbi:MAG: cytochrome C [Steroidobacteraceae bacterium]
MPSFARQTGMTCAACHTVFPELTPFGREFKLNGYVLDNIKQVTGIDIDSRQTLSLNQIPPISLMLQVSYTHTGSALPDSAISGAYAKDGEMLFPQQVSFFYAGKIADGLGAFIQLTYDGAEDHFGFDNTDVRYAHHFSFGGANDNNHELILGVTLNNNPTVQDVWNTTAAWGFPYSNSSVSPTPMTSAKIDSGAGGFGQTVGGIGVYAWLDDHLYVEITDYVSAIPGGAHPLDSTQTNVITGNAPYWRVAYEQRWDRNSLEVGAYGLDATVYPGNTNGINTALSGPTNKYKDVAGDVQYQFIGEDHLFTFLGTYIHESQTLNASFMDGFSANNSNTLNTTKLAGEYYYKRHIGGSIGYFNITGSTDPVLYSPAPVTGSANGSPNSNGYILEVNYLPWLNTKLQAQYVGYQKFNGQNGNNPGGYDGSARTASNNNTLYLLVWLNF